MSRKMVFTSVALILMVALSACSGLSLSSLTASAAQAGATATPNATPSALQGKLAIGILKLEGSSQAITTDQAGNLLFLWKGVKSLTSTQNSSKIELAALYQQIEDALTAEQVQAIDQVTVSQSEVATLRSQFGSQVAQGAAPSGSATTGTSSSSRSSSSQSQAFGGGFGGPGGGPSGELAILNGSGSASQTSSSTTNSSSSSSSQKAATPSAAKVSIDYNAIFADAVISLLQQRVSA